MVPIEVRIDIQTRHVARERILGVIDASTRIGRRVFA